MAKNSKMWLKTPSKVVTTFLSTIVLTLTLLIILTGITPTFLPDYTILSLKTTSLKDSYHEMTGAGLLIHDVYRMYMTTCAKDAGRMQVIRTWRSWA